MRDSLLDIEPGDCSDLARLIDVGWIDLRIRGVGIDHLCEVIYVAIEDIVCSIEDFFKWRCGSVYYYILFCESCFFSELADCTN